MDAVSPGPIVWIGLIGIIALVAGAMIANYRDSRRR